MSDRSASDQNRLRAADVRLRIIALVLLLGACVAAPAVAGPFVFSANRGSNDVTVADAWTRRVVATIPTAALPTDLVASPDGARLYVATDRHVTEIDLRTLDRRDIPYAPGLNDANGIVMHPNGRMVFVSHGSASFMTRIDLPSGSVSNVALPSFDVRHIAISDDGAWLFGVTRLGDLMQLDTASGATATLFSGAFSFPTGIATNDRNEVVVASDGNLGIEEFSVTQFGSAGSRRVLASGFRPAGVSYRGLGFGVWVTQPYDGAVFDTVSGSAVAITPFAGPFDVSAHPDSLFDVTANLGDVTGQAPMGAGSMSFITGSGVGGSVPAGVNPVAVTIASERGDDVMGDPQRPQFSYYTSGATVRKTIGVVSVGDSDAFVWDVAVVGADASAFKIISNGCRFTNVAYQQSCPVQVEFTAIPKTLPWYAKFLRVYHPSYTAALEVDIGGEAPVLIPLRAGATMHELRDDVKIIATTVPHVTLSATGD